MYLIAKSWQLLKQSSETIYNSSLIYLLNSNIVINES